MANGRTSLIDNAMPAQGTPLGGITDEEIEVEEIEEPTEMMEEEDGSVLINFDQAIQEELQAEADANLAEYKSGSSCGAPLWLRDRRGGVVPRQFSENAARREKGRRGPAKSIFETVLGRLWYFQKP